MMDQLRPYIDRINALTTRERVLIFAAIVVLMQQAWDSYLWLPLSSQNEQLATQIEQLEQKVAQTRAETGIYSKKLGEDPDLQARDALLQLEKKLASVNQKTRQASSQLVSPAEMVRLLEKLIVAEPELELLSLTTFEAEPMIPLPEEAKNNPRQYRYQVYRHAFTIEFSGGYLATLRYLEALEQLQWTFFWEEIDYKVDAYPESRIILKLYTLSLSPGWIGV